MSYDISKFRTDVMSYMVETGCSQNKLSRLTGVNVNTINKFLKYASIPCLKNLILISKCINKDLNEYSIGDFVTYEVKGVIYNDMSVDELNSLIERLVDIRDSKISIQLAELKARRHDIDYEISRLEEINR